jgi:type I restriction enzyme S subunit
MKYQPISTLVEPVRQIGPTGQPEELFPYVDISSVDRDTKTIVGVTRMRVADAPSRAKQNIACDDVLVSTVRPNLNTTARVMAWQSGAIASTGFCVLRARKADLDPDYLFYFTQSPGFVGHLTRIANGASYPAVTDDDIRAVRIPYPPLPEQQSIASRLQVADGLRRTRRHALQLCDELLPAAFLEMFGDFRVNIADAPPQDLEQIAEVVSGVTKGQRHNGRQTIEAPYLRVANVQDGYLDLSEIKRITASIADARDLILQPGDIVMTEGGDYDKLGRGAIWSGEIANCIHQNHVFRVRLDHSQILPSYFAALLRSPYAKDYFLSCAKQTTNLASINMTQLKAMPVPLPAMTEQKKFANLVQSHKWHRSTHVEALRQADHLFQTLLHEAFV